MKIQIKTQFKDVTVNLEDLTRDERRALAGLLGMSSKRQEIFKSLRTMPRFKKIKQEQVWALCPKDNKFQTKIQIEDAGDTDWGRGASLAICKFIPDADVYPKIRSLGGYCEICRSWHEIIKKVVVVSLVESGVKFSNIYEV